MKFFDWLKQMFNTEKKPEVRCIWDLENEG